MIVLSSDVAVKDLLDKRSARYSDRPDMHIGHRICSGSLRFLTMVSSFHIPSRGLSRPIIILNSPMDPNGEM